jgi:hypothetical protein
MEGYMSTANESQSRDTPSKEGKPQAHSAVLNLLVNIVFPAVILNKYSSPEYLGPTMGLIVALSLPFLYGAWEFATIRKHNLISILGFVSILLTGGLGLLQMDGFWFAVKEASIPGIIAVITLGSLLTKNPLVKVVLYNDKVINVPLVEQTLDARGSREGFRKLMFQATLLLAMSFVVSSVLNFGLAIWILTAPAGTAEFNEQLGRMTALSYPVIMLPSMAVMIAALWFLIHGLKKLTGLDIEKILAVHQ